MADLMNPGGGLTKSKLSLADASEYDVVSPKKFYSLGNKALKTGSLVDRGVETATSITVYEGNLYLRIPFGAYRTSSGPDGGTEVRTPRSAALSTLDGWVIVDLGVGNSFNVSGYSGYRNFNSSNFICEPQTLNWTSGTIWLGQGNYNAKAGFSMSKSYNSGSGVLTVTATVTGGWGGGSNVGTTVRCYLRYRP